MTPFDDEALRGRLTFATPAEAQAFMLGFQVGHHLGMRRITVDPADPRTLLVDLSLAYDARHFDYAMADYARAMEETERIR